MEKEKKSDGDIVLLAIGELKDEIINLKVEVKKLDKRGISMSSILFFCIFSIAVTIYLSPTKIQPETPIKLADFIKDPSVKDFEGNFNIKKMFLL